MQRIVVSDTTAITHLAKINALDVLKSLYYEIFIPEAVYNELLQVKTTQPGRLQVLNSSWIKVIPIKNNVIAKKLRTRLDLGETEAIVLALEKNADLLIIDEVAGRAVAKGLVNKIIGMVGVLLEAKKAGIIDEVQPYLNQLKSTGFRMSNEIFEFALSQAGESSSQINFKK